MLKQFAVLLKKDIKLIIRHKFLLVMLASLVIYSLYINFIYVSEGTKPIETNIYVLYEEQEQNLTSENGYITTVEDEEALINALEMDSDGIGIRIDKSGNPDSVILYHVSEKSDNLKALYGLNRVIDGYDGLEVPISYLQKGDLELKQRATMASVIIFFEIAAISFLGVAALFFKEKSMGVIKLYGILPASKVLYISSKVLLFLVLEIIFAVLMCLLNVGVEYSLQILPQVVLQVILLSPIMVLLGFLFALVYNNLKQFIFAYTLIIVMVTSPVFLFVTTSLEWDGIYALPTYYAYSSLYNAMLGNPNPILLYSLACIVTILGLTITNYNLMKREIERG